MRRVSVSHNVTPDHHGEGSARRRPLVATPPRSFKNVLNLVFVCLFV